MALNETAVAKFGDLAAAIADVQKWIDQVIVGGSSTYPVSLTATNQGKDLAAALDNLTAKTAAAKAAI